METPPCGKQSCCQTRVMSSLSFSALPCTVASCSPKFLVGSFLPTPFHACLLYVRQVISVASDSATPRTTARQAPLSMGFSRQEHWSGLPHASPGDLPAPGIEPTSHISCISRHVLYHLGSPLFQGALLLICNSVWGLYSILGPSPSRLILQIYFGVCETRCCLVAKLRLTLS